MPAEQESRREDFTRPESRQEASFDTLARGLATGTLSRRKALRLMGGALVGGALASLPGVAQARSDASICADYCRSLFPQDGFALRACINQARQGTGPCYECGPLGEFPPPNCQEGSLLEPFSCTCICPSGEPAPEPCPAGSVLDPELCSCVCPEGTFRCTAGGILIPSVCCPSGTICDLTDIQHPVCIPAG